MGLGVTLAALLTDVRVDRVDVVEIEPLLVRWLRSGLVPAVDAVLADPRVHVTVADISDVLRDVVINIYDGVLLDVDNGPDFLVRAANAAATGTPRCATLRGHLCPAVCWRCGQRRRPQLSRARWPRRSVRARRWSAPSSAMAAR
jgi:hypothetical protein